MFVYTLNLQGEFKGCGYFHNKKTEEELQPIDRFVVEEYLLDMLLYMNGCRKEFPVYMVGLPVSFQYEYLMAETIFS